MESDWAQDREKLVKTIMPVGGASKSQPALPSVASNSNSLFIEAAHGQLSCGPALFEAMSPECMWLVGLEQTIIPGVLDDAPALMLHCTKITA